MGTPELTKQKQQTINQDHIYKRDELSMHSDISAYSDMYDPKHKESNEYKDEVLEAANYIKHYKGKVNMSVDNDPLLYNKSQKKRGYFEKKKLEKDANKYIADTSKIEKFDFNREFFGFTDDLNELTALKGSTTEKERLSADISNMSSLTHYSKYLDDGTVSSIFEDMKNNLYLSGRDIPSDLFNENLISSKIGALKNCIDPKAPNKDFKEATIALNRLKALVKIISVQKEIKKDGKPLDPKNLAEYKQELQAFCGTVERKLKYNYMRDNQK